MSWEDGLKGYYIVDSRGRKMSVHINEPPISRDDPTGRECCRCGTCEYLLDERDICWNCVEEAAKERAIEEYADAHGEDY